MSEHRRKPPQDGGNAPGRRGAQPGGERQPPGGRPPYNGNPAGAPGAGGPGAGAPGSRRRATARPGGQQHTAQQPRMTRAEMRKAAKRGGGRAANGTTGPSGRAGRTPPKKRFIDYPRWGKSGVRRWLPSWKQMLSVFLIFFGGSVAAVGVAYSQTTLPDLNKAVQQQNNIYQWSDGTTLATTGETNRQIVHLDHISTEMQWAAISAENASFKTDHGIDPKGIARAVLNMAQGGETQGGSTITQQYVKNAFLSQDQTLSRKVKELFVTLRVDKEKSKEEILEGYLNTSWFGRGSYGVQAAAKAYYNMNAKDLDACHAAMLAGLLKGAGYYDPSLNAANHARAVARWGDILDNMVRFNHLSQADRDKCTTFPEPVKEQGASNLGGQKGYLVDTAQRFVKSKGIEQKDLDRGGYTIRTTFDKKKVAELEAAVKKVSKANFDAKKRPKTDSDVQVGAASVEPGTGKIVALYGGPDYLKHFTNNADSTGIPIGSTMKPIVLASAMEYGVQTKLDSQGKPTRITPDSRYNGNDKIRIRQLDGNYVTQQDGSVLLQTNESPKAWGYISLRTAMLYSVNTPFVQLGEDVGLKKVSEMSQAVGLRKESLASLNASFSIGTSTPSAIRMANAYATFAASGTEVDPYSVVSVTHEGTKLKGFGQPESNRAMDAAVADTVTDVLKDVIWKDGGTGAAAKALGRVAAGKTGTTDENKSAWFVGYTPQLSTAVAMWREKPGSKKGLQQMYGLGTGNISDSVHGGKYPTEIWTEYMTAALQGTQEQPFPTPGDLDAVKLDASGAPSTASPSPSASASSEPPSAPPSDTPSRRPPSAPTMPDPGNSDGFPDGGGNGNGAGGWNTGGVLGGGNGNGNGPGGTSPTPVDSPETTPSAPEGGGGGRPGGVGGGTGGGWLGGTTGAADSGG
ncbi:transglycosylase domain-containing protein [Peterkaempfera bronchialis]|uniref:Penicillin-binding protein n=1 Tax=Peterkaempfera bronchialis TaxID=2126346 RepID=A0A345SY02_9ACTN|nr:transglycosylase domain-containing protein [Peterkaempfera bronchialis]AXI78607.1 penicillin-binding protein [Peterkaempfera bronchialis]